MLHQFLRAALVALPLLAACEKNTDPVDPSGNPTTNTATGTITLGDAIAVYDADAATGALTRRFSGIMPHRLPGGETVLRLATNLAEVNAAGTETRTIIESASSPTRTFREEFNNPRVSPDGTLIAYSGKWFENTYVVRRDNGQLVATLRGVHAPEWTPGGGLVVAAVDGSGILVAAAPTSTPTPVPNSPRSVASIAVSADGRTLAVIANKTLSTLGIDGSGLRTASQLGELSSPAWSPDGRWIAVERRGTLVLVPAAGGDVVEHRFAGSGIDGVHGPLTWR